MNFYIVETVYYKQKFIVRAGGVMEAKRKAVHALAKLKINITAVEIEVTEISAFLQDKDVARI